MDVPMGLHRVEAACPRCGAIELIWVSLGAPALRLRAKAKAVEHDCGSTPPTPATLFDTAGEGRSRTFDH